MLFTYSYKTSDGVRHEAEMEAKDAPSVFAELRARGIRPIKVHPKGDPDGVIAARRRFRRRLFVLLPLVSALVGVVAYLLGRETTAEQPNPAPMSRGHVVESQVVSLADAIAQQAARARPRRWFAEVPPITALSRPSERFLANFAQPGELVKNVPPFDRALEDDLLDAMEEGLTVAEGDPADVAQLKRIVIGMLDDARVYVKTGKSVREYAGYLKTRQKMEHAFRRDMIRSVESGEISAAEATEQLSAMGFRPLVTHMGKNSENTPLTADAKK